MTTFSDARPDTERAAPHPAARPGPRPEPVPDTSGEPLLQAVDLAKRYGEVQALDGFSLSVRRGEIVGLVGHNGAGKTTFVEMVSGLARPDSGSVLIDGRRPAKARAEVGVAPQHISLYPPITVREHLSFFGSLSGLRRRGLRSEVEQLATALVLTSFLDRPVGLLSGGQQRRTQAAVALIHRPKLLLLDEPTAGADPETREALLGVVRQRAAEGAAVVYTTHYLQELTELEATIAVARRGRVIARGTASELLDGLPGEVRVGFADGEEQYRSTTDPTAALLELLAGETRPVGSVHLRNPDLDDLYRFLAVTDER